MPRRKASITAQAEGQCQVCRHKDRHLIEQARIAGCTLDSIAERFGASRDSIHRHMRLHVPEPIVAAYLADVPLAELAARAAEESVSLLDGLALVRKQVFQQLLIASTVNDGHRVATLAGRCLEVLREVGKVTGELRSLGPRQVTNNNVLVLASPVVVDLQKMLLDRLRPYPEARAAVLDGLKAIEAKAYAEAGEGARDAA